MRILIPKRKIIFIGLIVAVLATNFTSLVTVNSEAYGVVDVAVRDHFVDDKSFSGLVRVDDSGKVSIDLQRADFDSQDEVGLDLQGDAIGNILNFSLGFKTDLSPRVDQPLAVRSIVQTAFLNVKSQISKHEIKNRQSTENALVVIVPPLQMYLKNANVRRSWKELQFSVSFKIGNFGLISLQNVTAIQVMRC